MPRTFSEAAIIKTRDLTPDERNAFHDLVEYLNTGSWLSPVRSPRQLRRFFQDYGADAIRRVETAEGD
jgi:hypothetical protein